MLTAAKARSQTFVMLVLTIWASSTSLACIYLASANRPLNRELCELGTRTRADPNPSHSDFDAKWAQMGYFDPSYAISPQMESDVLVVFSPDGVQSDRRTKRRLNRTSPAQQMVAAGRINSI